MWRERDTDRIVGMCPERFALIAGSKERSADGVPCKYRIRLVPYTYDCPSSERIDTISGTGAHGVGARDLGVQPLYSRLRVACDVPPLWAKNESEVDLCLHVGPCSTMAGNAVASYNSMPA